jgi:hypothetical protein
VVLTSTYWLVGQRIVEHEQSGSERAGYGEALKQLADDITGRLGRGFSERNIRQMRLFNLGWPIPPTVSAESGMRNRLPRHNQLNLPDEAEIAARIDAARRLLSAAPARHETPGGGN